MTRKPLRTFAVAFGSVLALALVVALPVISADSDTDLQTLLQAAQAKSEKMQGDLAGWAGSLQGRDGVYRQDAAAVQAASQGQLIQGLKQMDDPSLRAAAAGGDVAPAGSKGGVYVAVSFSMPPQQLRILAADARKAGARVVIRGLVGGSFKATLLKAKEVFDDQSTGGLAIDPQVFKAFSVDAVPTVIAAQGPIQPCGALGCTPVPPAFDKIAGNISLEAALQAIAGEGDSGRNIARAALDRLKG